MISMLDLCEFILSMAFAVTITKAVKRKNTDGNNKSILKNSLIEDAPEVSTTTRNINKLRLRNCTISAPGKALIAGGYLVLEHPNIGLTIAASACFHTSVNLLELGGQRNDSIHIIVYSPQFYISYDYTYSFKVNKLQSMSDKQNIFIETALLLALNYTREFYGHTRFESILHEIAGNGTMGIKLRADNDFYSQIKELERNGLPRLSKSLQQLPAFVPCPRDDYGRVLVAKTGMGSSAALTSSLVGALLHSLQVVELYETAPRPLQSLPLNRLTTTSTHPSGTGSVYFKSDKEKWDRFEKDLEIVHNIAQLAHAMAQGKLGSGFDVAAAIYGSQIYRRFDPSGLQRCMDLSFESDETAASILKATVESKELWSQLSIQPFSLPAGMGLVMGDICGGSSSTAMAREVLRWRKEKGEEAQIVWNSLADTNNLIASTLSELILLEQSDREDYVTGMSRAASVPGHCWDSIVDPNSTGVAQRVIDNLNKLRGMFCKARAILKRLGEEAGVDVEPDTQTALADATQNLPGVLVAGVPGAGGADAIFAITLSEEGRDAIENLWSGWNEGGIVCPLVLKERLGLEGGHAGIAVSPNIPWN